MLERIFEVTQITIDKDNLETIVSLIFIVKNDKRQKNKKRQSTMKKILSICWTVFEKFIRKQRLL